MMNKEKIMALPPIQVEDIGLYVRVIARDYEVTDNKQIAELITEYFGVYCTEEDINNYESLWYHEDYERISREVEFNVSREIY
tara:strand:+ start:456 stop:704 length:249 start_codon:yes stop_codon:yes gene_type:complete